MTAAIASYVTVNLVTFDKQSNPSNRSRIVVVTTALQCGYTQTFNWTDLQQGYLQGQGHLTPNTCPRSYHSMCYVQFGGTCASDSSYDHGAIQIYLLTYLLTYLHVNLVTFDKQSNGRRIEVES